MDHEPTRPLVAPSTPAGEPSNPQIATCPMCHTAHPSLTSAVVDAGEDWRCSRCGQRWDAERLLVVAGYAAWVREHEGASAAAARPAPHLRLLPGRRDAAPPNPEERH